jgi:hypothetical protein
MALYIRDLEDIRNELYEELKTWERRAMLKVQHDVQAMREFIDVRIESIKEKRRKGKT